MTAIRWRIVPVEPTKEMLDALANALDVSYLDASDTGPRILSNPRAAWRAAVNAAPYQGAEPGGPETP